MSGRSIAIVGLGSMGSMALWQLARRGIRAVGFEQFALGHANGAFSGETRMFRTAYSNGPHWVPTLRLAKDLWRTLERETRQELLDLNGFVSIGRPGTERLDSLIACANKMALAVEVLDARAVHTRYPALALRDGEIAVHDREGGLIKPERAVMAASSRAEALGAVLFRNTAVTAIVPHDGGVTIRTATREHEFGSVIVTAGSWSSAFLPPGLVTPHRVGLHWYLSRTPDLFTPERFPSHIRYVDGRSVCLFSSQDRTTVKAAIGGSLGPLDQPMDGRTADPWERPVLSEAIQDYYPDLWPEPIRSESYADGFTRDGDGVIGPLPGVPNIVFAAGFSAHGFKIAPVVGAALADIAVTGTTMLPIDHLRIDRFNTVALDATP